MTQPTPDPEDARPVVVVGENGRPDASALGDTDVARLVEQPAKVMRIGSMIKQLLEEVRAAPLDEASRARLKEIHEVSLSELEQGLAPELAARVQLEQMRRPALPPGATAPGKGPDTPSIPASGTGPYL